MSSKNERFAQMSQMTCICIVAIAIVSIDMSLDLLCYMKHFLLTVCGSQKILESLDRGVNTFNTGEVTAPWLFP